MKEFDEYDEDSMPELAPDEFLEIGHQEDTPYTTEPLDKENDGEERNTVKELLNTLIYLAVVVLLAFLVVTFVGEHTVVDGDSMLPNFHNGDRLIAEKISYLFHDPERFDVIIFDFVETPGKLPVHYIKRVIGLPGETVQIIDGYVYINNRKLTEDTYGNAVMEYSLRAADPVTLGPDEFFVLGDNRNNSKDSRTVEVGNIKKKDIVGRAWWRFYPFNNVNFIEHQKD